MKCSPLREDMGFVLIDLEGIFLEVGVEEEEEEEEEEVRAPEVEDMDKIGKCIGRRYRKVGICTS